MYRYLRNKKEKPLTSLHFPLSDSHCSNFSSDRREEPPPVAGLGAVLPGQGVAGSDVHRHLVQPRQVGGGHLVQHAQPRQLGLHRLHTYSEDDLSRPLSLTTDLPVPGVLEGAEPGHQLRHALLQPGQLHAVPPSAGVQRDRTRAQERVQLQRRAAPVRLRNPEPDRPEHGE